MSSYNLNEQAGQDYFEFTLDDFKYRMAYPSGNEVLQLNEISENGEEWAGKIESLTQSLTDAPDDKKNEIETQIKEYTAKAKMAQQTFLDWCLAYVTPELESAPDVRQAILNKSIKYLSAFVKMVQTELGNS
jgi:hypothetical protein